ncbi:hypothetical protein BT93_J1714 [Corymbia citriodora subsp. variegata]|nr:hypothetical protein BT93_J1714 [Corymbia citriodora subsp. variegata]
MRARYVEVSVSCNNRARRLGQSRKTARKVQKLGQEILLPFRRQKKEEEERMKGRSFLNVCYILYLLTCTMYFI